jgi:hypothetical protein
MRPLLCINGIKSDVINYNGINIKKRVGLASIDTNSGLIDKNRIRFPNPKIYDRMRPDYSL